jgi:hypothetical protein
MVAAKAADNEKLGSLVRVMPEASLDPERPGAGLIARRVIFRDT